MCTSFKESFMKGTFLTTNEILNIGDVSVLLYFVSFNHKNQCTYDSDLIANGCWLIAKKQLFVFRTVNWMAQQSCIICFHLYQKIYFMRPVTQVSKEKNHCIWFQIGCHVQIKLNLL